MVELEEEYDQGLRQERSESLWVQLIEKIVKKRTSSIVETDGYSLIPDMDDITTEVSDYWAYLESMLIKSFSSQLIVQILLRSWILRQHSEV